MRKKDMFLMVLISVSREIKDLDNYHTMFLSTMVLRKIRNPEEDLQKTVKNAMKTMTFRYSNHEIPKLKEEEIRRICIKFLAKNNETYGKTDVVEVSVEKSLESLEEALEIAELPKELVERGYNVQSVWLYLVEKAKKNMLDNSESLELLKSQKDFKVNKNFIEEIWEFLTGKNSTNKIESRKRNNA